MKLAHFAAAAVALALAGSESDALAWQTAPSDDPRLGPARTLDTLHLFSPPSTLDAWKQRADEVRLRVRVAAGLDPEPEKTPLNARVFGAIDRGEYTVEKVAFESIPGFYVTGNLYRPKATGVETVKHAGVLCPHGHWDNGRLFERSEVDAKKEIERGAEQTMEGARFPLQARCAQLARMGCVVFFYDMVGFAECTQIGHGEGFLDVESMLWGVSTFGLQTWNSIRALDFLCGLPDVDVSRIGVTGASGGGTQTFALCALDDRPAAAFPAVMVSSRMQGGCICENAPLLRIDTDNVEIAALFAPKPLGLTGANDWTLHIVEEGLPELKRVYALYGAEDRVAAWCHPEFDHNYNQVSREHMYAWFARHLGLVGATPVSPETSVHERPFEPIAPDQLRVFDDEHPRPADAIDASGVLAHFREQARRQVESVDGPSRVVLELLVGASRLEARDVSGITSSSPDGGQGPEIAISHSERDGARVLATLHAPIGDARGIVVGVSGRGRSHFSTGTSLLLPRDLQAAGIALLAVDPIGVGESGSGAPVDSQRHADYAGYSFTYNRTTLAEQVGDVLLAIGYARSISPGVPIVLVGLDGAGPAVALAAALDDGVHRTIVDLDFEFTDVASPDDPRFLPCALRYGGMESFLGLIAPRELSLIGDRSIPERTRACYRALEADIALKSYSPAAMRATPGAIAALITR